MNIFKARRNLIFGIFLLAFLSSCRLPTPPPPPTPHPTPTLVTTVELAQPSPLPSAEPTATVTPVPALPASVTTLTVFESLPEVQRQMLAEDIQAFQRQFPRYEVNLRHYDSPESLTTTEANFDVALTAPGVLSQLWSDGRLAPLSNFFPPAFLNDFAGVTLLGASRDNQVWGLADTAGFHLLLFYNRDLVDTPPQTTAELVYLAQQLTQATQSAPGRPRWGLAVNSYDPLWLTPWLTAYGGWLTDEAGRPTLNTPAMQSALTLYLGWQGRLTGIAPVATYEEARHRFFNGDIAMMIDGDWAIAELARTHKINWGVALLPNVGEAGAAQPAAPLVLARYWVVHHAVAGDRALAVAAFLDYITRSERQLAWTRHFGLLPTRRAALNDAVISNDPTLRISAAQMLAGRAIPPGANADALLNAMREPLRGVIDGELTPQQAVELMQANTK